MAKIFIVTTIVVISFTALFLFRGTNSPTSEDTGGDTTPVTVGSDTAPRLRVSVDSNTARKLRVSCTDAFDDFWATAIRIGTDAVNGGLTSIEEVQLQQDQVCMASIVNSDTYAVTKTRDDENRDKCRLKCGCPPTSNKLPSPNGCKYQTSKDKCVGYYSDYGWYGDRSCFWNALELKCEAGASCRDDSFDFGTWLSTCPPCSSNEPMNEPQWSQLAVQNAGLPSNLKNIRETGMGSGELSWCSTKLVGSCTAQTTRSICERSHGPGIGSLTNQFYQCQWVGDAPSYVVNFVPHCRIGKICDNSFSEREQAATELGLQYYDYAWRNETSSRPIDQHLCHWGSYTHLVTKGCPSYRANSCSDFAHDMDMCNNAYYVRWDGSFRFCKWEDGSCEATHTHCDPAGDKLHGRTQSQDVCDPSEHDQSKPVTQIVVDIPNRIVSHVYKDEVQGWMVSRSHQLTASAPAPAPTTPIPTPNPTFWWQKGSKSSRGTGGK